MQFLVGLAAWYAIFSVLTFIAYTIDKLAAMRNGARLREDSLHLLSLLGGWPGALAAQKIVRHKSSKESFQLVFWLTMLANCLTLTAVVIALRS